VSAGIAIGGQHFAKQGLSAFQADAVSFDTVWTATQHGQLGPNVCVRRTGISPHVQATLPLLRATNP
jgi:hypothetical protein